MQERNYCVYQHKNKTNGKVYIGITGQRPESRWLKGKGYIHCPYFGKAIELYGWDGFEHNILLDNLTKQEAEQKEIELIEYYNSTNKNYGYNILRGGDLGCSKYVYQYDGLTGKFIKKWDSTISAEQELGITEGCVSLACSGYTKTTHGLYFSYKDFGEHLPDEILKQINTNKCYVPVAQYDLDGKYITSYPSLIEASRSVGGVNNTKRIQIKNKTSYGYIWKPIINDSVDYTQNLDLDELHKNESPINSKECYQYSSNGVFITSFISTTEASKSINGTQSVIASACRNHNQSYGYYWRYAVEMNGTNNLTKKDMERIHGGSRAVYQYDLNGNFVRMFHSLTEAANVCKTATTNISKVCKGQLNQTSGFIFRYEPTNFTEQEINEIKKHYSKKMKIAQ